MHKEHQWDRNEEPVNSLNFPFELNVPLNNKRMFDLFCTRELINESTMRYTFKQ